MSERTGAGALGGLVSRVGSVLRSLWNRTLHLWRSSLGFRVVVVTMLLGVLVLTAVGTYLYGSIAQGLVDSRQRIAAEDSLSDARATQRAFDTTDLNKTQGELTQFATDVVKKYSRSAGNETRYVVLAPLDTHSNAPVIIPALDSGTGEMIRFIPNELRSQVAAQPDRQHLQVATIEDGNDSISAVMTPPVFSVTNRMPRAEKRCERRSASSP